MANSDLRLSHDLISSDPYLFWDARNGITLLKNSTNAGVPPNNT